MRNSNVALVTGAAGFLGRYIAREYSSCGWRVVGIGRRPGGQNRRDQLAAFYDISLPDARLERVVSDHVPAVCIHCAGPSSVAPSIDNPASDFYASPVMTFELLDTLRKHAPKCRFVFLSSAAVYGNPAALPVSESQSPAPISPYGFHKLQCEQLCAEYASVYDLRTASVRIFSAYGEGLRKQVLWDICNKALNESELTLRGSGVESRDFVHATDVARAISTIAAQGVLGGEVYNVGSACQTTISELAGMILRELQIDRAIAFDGSAPRGIPLNWRADITKLERLGYASSIALSEGVSGFVRWCKQELAR